jgi:O-antigen/teichoic acid export membrane protein
LWALPLLYLNFLLTHQLIAWDLQSYFAVLCGSGLVVNLCLNVTLVPSFGIQGAAWSTVLTEVFLTGGWIWVLLSRRK